MGARRRNERGEVPAERKLHFEDTRKGEVSSSRTDQSGSILFCTKGNTSKAYEADSFFYNILKYKRTIVRSWHVRRNTTLRDALSRFLHINTYINTYG